MESLWHDVKFAVRLLSKERGFTAGCHTVVFLEASTRLVRLPLLLVQAGVALVPVVGVGLLVGALLAAVLTKLVAALLFGVGRFDPVTIAAVLGVVGTIGLIACYVPAFRATRMSPVELLREE